MILLMRNKKINTSFFYDKDPVFKNYMHIAPMADMLNKSLINKFPIIKKCIDILPDGIYYSNYPFPILTNNQEYSLYLTDVHTNSKFVVNDKLTNTTDFIRLINQETIRVDNHVYYIDELKPIYKEQDYIRYYFSGIEKHNFNNILLKNDYMKSLNIENYFVGYLLIYIYFNILIDITRKYLFLANDGIGYFKYANSIEYNAGWHRNDFYSNVSNYLNIDSESLTSFDHDFFDETKSAIDYNYALSSDIIKLIIQDGWNMISLKMVDTNLKFNFEGDYRINDWEKTRWERERS